MGKRHVLDPHVVTLGLLIYPCIHTLKETRLERTVLGSVLTSSLSYPELPFLSSVSRVLWYGVDGGKWWVVSGGWWMVTCSVRYCTTVTTTDRYMNFWRFRPHASLTPLFIPIWHITRCLCTSPSFARYKHNPLHRVSNWYDIFLSLIGISSSPTYITYLHTEVHTYIHPPYLDDGHRWLTYFSKIYLLSWFPSFGSLFSLYDT